MTGRKVGAATIDITPDAAMLARGLRLAGFAARDGPAAGIHDPLTARAVVVDDTAIVAADVIAMHEDMSARIRARCVLPAERVIVTATHTHGAPFSAKGLLGGRPDQAFLQLLEDGCVAAIDAAFQARRPATLAVGLGADPGVARNRRHPGGPVDGAVPVLHMRDAEGVPIAIVASYACHPVVLGADNRAVTADYPGIVRQRLEAARPGAVALFLTGCCGDANTGHSAAASLSLASDDGRSFSAANRHGDRIAAAALAAALRPATGETRAASTFVALDIARRETDLPALAAAWRAERQTADPIRRRLLDHWIRWADTATDPVPWSGRVSVLHWGGVPIIAMPGEIFARTALDLRAEIDGPAFVLAYADAVPGYVPPRGEYRHGGYEVDEAHRFFGMPGAFAPGSAERLADAARSLLRGSGPDVT